MAHHDQAARGERHGSVGVNPHALAWFCGLSALMVVACYWFVTIGVRIGLLTPCRGDGAQL